MNEQEIYERLTSAEQSIKSAHHRIDAIAGYNKNISEMLVEMKYMRRDINELIERVSAIESRPVRRYDVVLNSLITAVVAGIVSFLLR